MGEVLEPIAPESCPQNSSMRTALLSACVLPLGVSFTPIHPVSISRVKLSFGLPSWIPDPSRDSEGGEDAPESASSEPPPAIGLKGLVQLITAGAGSPFLGDYKGVDEETGNFMFELEANNLTDENGQSRQTKMPYFEDGWVDEDEEPFKWPWQK